MKYFRLLCAGIIFFSTSLCGFAKTSDTTVFYVSSKGNDSWSGKLAEPGKKDGPFATPVRARNAIRELKKSGNMPSGGVIVYLKSGIYSLKDTFRLTDEDSGAEGSPVVWKSFPGEKVSFIGGKTASGFKAVSDKKVLSRLDNSANNKILQADLKSQGITDFGQISSSGWRNGKVGMEVFFRGKPMKMARYPNEGWLKVADVPQTGEKLYYEGIDWAMRDGIPAGKNYGRFVYDSDRPFNWKDISDVWMLGYWSWDWAESYEKNRQNRCGKKRNIFRESPACIRCIKKSALLFHEYSRRTRLPRRMVY